MIKFEKIILCDNDKPLDLIFNNGLNFLDYDNKYIFDLLSLKNQIIKSGSFIVDDFHVFPLMDPRKYAFVLNINSKVININAVFILPLSLKDKTRTELKKSLITLKDLPLNDENEKQDKINKILDILKKHNASYVLLDLNDDINQQNAVLIKTVIESNFKDFNIFILNQKVIQLINEDINLNDVTNENGVYEIEVTQEIKKVEIEKKLKQESNTIPDYGKEFINFDKPLDEIKIETKKDKLNYLILFSKQLFKFNYLYYLFIALFSIFLGICSLSSLYLIRTDNVIISIVLIILNIVFLIMNGYILASTTAGMKTYLDDIIKKIIYTSFFILFSIIGFAIGYGITYLMSTKNIFVDFEKFILNDYILFIIVGCVTLILPILSFALTKIYIYLKDKILTRK